MLWKRKKIEDELPCEPETITLSPDDLPHERARKIWRLLGFRNDRFGAAAQMAEYLAWYQRADEQRFLPSTGTGQTDPTPDDVRM